MSTITDTPAPVARPAWADPARDSAVTEGHPSDLGTEFESAPVDAWGVDGHRSRVTVTGFRSHDGEIDESQILAEVGSPAHLPVAFPIGASEARRLAAALVKAAELLEGDER